MFMCVCVVQVTNLKPGISRMVLVTAVATRHTTESLYAVILQRASKHAKRLQSTVKNKRTLTQKGTTMRACRQNDA